MEDLTRRAAVVTGALGAAAVASLAGRTSAAELTAVEAANVKVVKDFCATWGAKDFDPDVSARTYFTPDASVRVLDTMPFVVGPAAIGAAFKPFLQHGERFKVEFRDVYAKGPLVVAHRIDTQVAPGQADKPVELVGVFLVRGGRIKEWSDYLVAA